MLTIKNYVTPESIQGAYEYNQKRSARILAGCGWIRMSNASVQTAIDLSRLGLDQIEETEDSYIIGAMVTLHQLECHEGLNKMTKNAIRESVKHIVGIQFRNCATIGGSIFGRFGFSDLFTCFLALDTEVKLYKTGRVALEVFADMPKDDDILTHIIIKKTENPIVYVSQRNTATDFPVIACAVARKNGRMVASVGARPKLAKLVVDEEYILAHKMTGEDCQKFAEYVAEQLDFGSNIRASAEYRKYLTKILVKRACESISKMEEN